MNGAMTQTQALLFDLDGTLVDSEVIGLDVLHDMAANIGFPGSREDSHQRFRGVPMGQCVHQIMQEVPHDQLVDSGVFLQTLRARMAIRFKQGLQEMPDASRLLAGLRIPFAVATNGPREKAALTLGLTGLDRYVGKHLYCAPEVGSYKPDPGLFLHAAQALGVVPGHCAVVEDSLAGLQAGLSAGMRVLCLHPPVHLSDADRPRVHFISGLTEVERLL